MLWIFVFCSLFGILVLFNVPHKIWRYYNLCKAMRRIPSLPAHWLMGHAHIIDYSQEFAFKVYNWRVKNKFDVIMFWLGPSVAFVNVTNPEYIKSLLRTSKAEIAYSMLIPWLGRGLLTENGTRWFKNRRLLTPAFHFDILKPYVHVYNDCTDILLTKWEKCALEGSTVEVYKTISQLTLDIILRCACSHFSNCQYEGDSYVNAVRDLCDLSGLRFLSFTFSASDFLYFNFSQQGKKYKKALKIAHSHSEKIIKDRKSSFKNVAEFTNSKLKCLDFLDVLLMMNEKEGEDRLNDTEIRNEVDTFVFEGYDTTATALTWTLYFLAKFPEHQEKCRQEIKDVLRGRNHLDYDDLPKLQYTQCCIKESMRFFPPVHGVHRQLSEDVYIGKYYVPKECYVTIDIAGIHKNPDIWENPLEYNPLRFHPDYISSDRHPFAFMPFSAGPRNCIGQNFAFNEEQVVIGSILNKFTLEIANERIKESLEFVHNILLRPAEELHLKITPLD